MKLHYVFLIAVICILVEIHPFGTGGEIAFAQCVQPPSGIEAWWPFDETQQTGSPAHDIAGVDNFANWINNPTPATGKVGNALSFNGTNYVEAADHAELNFGTGNFSIDVWIKSSDATGVRVMLDKRTGVSPLVNITGYNFYLYNGRPGMQLADGGLTLTITRQEQVASSLMGIGIILLLRWTEGMHRV